MLTGYCIHLIFLPTTPTICFATEIAVFTVFDSECELEGICIPTGLCRGSNSYVSCKLSALIYVQMFSQALRAIE